MARGVYVILIILIVVRSDVKCASAESVKVYRNWPSRLKESLLSKTADADSLGEDMSDRELGIGVKSR